MSLLRFFFMILLACLAACNPRAGHESHSSGKPDTLEMAPPVVPDTASPQMPAVDSASTGPLPADTTRAGRPVVLDSFKGTVKGFRVQAFTFHLATGRAVRLALEPPAKRVVFKLYRKTGDLDETVLKEEMKVWEGELEAGEYVAKVFLPLLPANRTRTETFRFRVLSQP